MAIMQRTVNTLKSIKGQPSAPPLDAVQAEKAIANDPAVYFLTVAPQQSNGITIITARVSSPTGWDNKSHVLQGHITASRLAEAIANVGSW